MSAAHQEWWIDLIKQMIYSYFLFVMMAVGMSVEQTLGRYTAKIRANADRIGMILLVFVCVFSALAAVNKDLLIFLETLIIGAIFVVLSMIIIKGFDVNNLFKKKD